ncbi:MAG TPA: nitroreductase/quinone reductase family protein [Acidimicrobiia bacterium]
MTDTQTVEVQLPDDRPPDWANSLMKWALTTPVLQSMIGQGVALLSFKGRKTGKPFTIPVSYHREDDVVTIITKRQRQWWHNFESPLDVELRLAGRDYTGEAEIESDDSDTREFMVEYLEKRPIDAKAYGLAKDEITREKIARIVPHIVVIRIAITPVD